MLPAGQGTSRALEPTSLNEPEAGSPDGSAKVPALSDDAYNLIAVMEVGGRAGNETGRAGKDTTQRDEKPKFWDFVIVTVFVVDLALLASALPEAWLKSTQADFLEKVLPIVGGGLFALFAAWYETRTVSISRNLGFRILLFLILTPAAVLFAIPIFPVQVDLYPRDAILYLDVLDASTDVQTTAGAKAEQFLEIDEPEHLRKWQQAVFLSLGTHRFYLKHYDDGGSPTTEKFERNWRDLATLMLQRKPLELRMIYMVRFSSQTEWKVKIQKTDGPFGDDFLRRDVLNPHQLEEMDKKTVKLVPQRPDITDPETYLPVGNYTAVTLKEGCSPSEPVPFKVSATRLESGRRKSLKPPQCATK